LLFLKKSCEEYGSYTHGAIKTLVLDMTSLASALINGYSLDWNILLWERQSRK